MESVDVDVLCIIVMNWIVIIVNYTLVMKNEEKIKFEVDITGNVGTDGLPDASESMEGMSRNLLGMWLGLSLSLSIGMRRNWRGGLTLSWSRLRSRARKE